MQCFLVNVEHKSVHKEHTKPLEKTPNAYLGLGIGLRSLVQQLRHDRHSSCSRCEVKRRLAAMSDAVWVGTAL